MERKQVLFLLFLVLAVALLSFTLGVMVGRRGSPAMVQPSAQEAPARMPVAKDGVAGKPADAAAADAAMQPRPGENLTFYDSLPKGDQAPLGSGINLPPEEKKPAAPETAVVAPPPATVGPTVSAPAVAPKPAVKPAPTAAVAPAPTAAVAPAPTAAVAPAPTAAAPAPAPAEPAPTVPPAKPAEAGAYVVQVASFQLLTDARTLKERLVKKGYGAYVQETDLGAKGIWHRVYVGPFADSATAGQAVERLVAEERLSAMVRKR